MYSQPSDGINGLAASAYATQWGAGYCSDPSFPRRVRAGTPGNSPAVGGVRYHVAQYVGGVAYSDAPNALRLIGACSVHSRSPQELREVSPSLFFGSGAELPRDAGADCADGNKVRLPLLNNRAVGNGSLSEIFRQCLVSRKPSQTLKHLDSYRFHCRKEERTGESVAWLEKGFANS